MNDNRIFISNDSSPKAVPRTPKYNRLQCLFEIDIEEKINNYEGILTYYPIHDIGAASDYKGWGQNKTNFKIYENNKLVNELFFFK